MLHFEAHTPAGSVGFQLRSQPFVHTSAIWKTRTQQFSLRNQEEQRQKHLEFVAAVHLVFLVLIGRLSLWPCPTNRSHTEPIMLVINAHSAYPGRRFWSRARAGSAKCDGDSPYFSNGQHETVKNIQVALVIHWVSHLQDASKTPDGFWNEITF